MKLWRRMWFQELLKDGEINGIITYQHILSEINRGEIKPLYLFLGEEDYEKKETIERLKDVLFQKRELMELNFITLYGDTTDVRTIINTCETLPILVKKRLVVINRADLLSKEDRDKLGMYVKNTSPTTCLVIQAKSWDASHNLFLNILKRGRVVRFFLPFEREVSSFIVRYLKRFGKGITSDAINLLIENVGRDKANLTKEMEKLLLYRREKSVFEKEDITDLVSKVRLVSIFDLIDLIGEGKIHNALIILNQLLAKEEHPLKILATLTSHLRLIFETCILLNDKKSSTQMEDYLRLRSKKRLNLLIKQARLFSKKNLIKIWKRLLETDLAIKSKDKKLHPLIMELLIIDLCKKDYLSCLEA
ncbi:MAG: DNA polymerase III subunit delta [bacterium]|nr:DNA polymerase III subunit delta [bacterium]